MNKKTLTIVFAYFLVVTAVVTYFPTLFNNIINWEDGDLFDVISLLQRGNISLFSRPEYAPLELAFLAFQRSFSEYGYFLFHALSMTGHAINAVLLYFLVRKVLASEKIAIVASVLFAVHPIEVGTVAWLSGQSTVFSTLFLLLSCFSYLRFKLNGMKLYWWLTLLCSALFYSIGSPALYLILILIGFDLMRESSLKIEHVTSKGILFLLWIVSFVSRTARAGGLNYLLQLYFDSITMLRLGITEIVVRIFFPLHDRLVASVNDVALQSSIHGESVFPFIFFLLAVVLLWNRKTFPVVFSGFLFLIVTSLPLFTGRASAEWALTDRSFYLPAAGVFLWLGALLEKAYDATAKRRAITAALSVLCGCVFLVLVNTSRSRADYWKDSITFWGKAHEENPANTFVLTKSGMDHSSRYEMAPALLDLTKVVDLTPDDGEAFINRGTVLLDALDYDDAISDFIEAARLLPADPHAEYDLGLAFARSSMLDSAEGAFSRAIELDPKFAQAFEDRANVLAKKGKYVLAFADYHHALELEPEYLDAYGNRAFAFMQTGNFGRALADFAEVIKLAPYRIDARIFYGYTMMSAGDTVGASAVFSDALLADSTHAKKYLLGESGVFLKSDDEKLLGDRLFRRLGIE